MGGRKAFVSHVDSHLGKVLCKRLAAADFETIGTSGDVSGKGVKWAKVVPTTSVDLLRKSLLESDVVVYQLEDSVDEATAALKVLMNEHFEVEKTFVLVSSTMTWYETETAMRAERAQDPPEGDEEDGAEEEVEQPTYAEEEYAKRVPHVKYQLWKELEKLCKKANTETLHTYCVFAGLQYGGGEDKLHPIFKQAWHLSEGGLPIFGKGDNHIPMVHVRDLASLVYRLGVADAPLDQRYFFATDEGNVTWNNVISAINTQLGNGKTFSVPKHDLVLYENIEHFVVNLKVEMGKMQELVEDEEWVSKSGFVENAASVVAEYKATRGIDPLKLAVLGPPMSGKSFYSRELSFHYKVPCFTVYDIIQDYQQQQGELGAELQRMKTAQKEARLREKIADLRAKKKAEAEAAAAEAAEGGDAEKEKADDDGDDLLQEAESEDELFDDDLIEELERAKQEAGEGAEEDELEETEEMVVVREQLAQVARILAMTEKPPEDPDAEAANPKDKKKDKGAKGAPPPEEDKPKLPVRYTDRCLAFIVQWKLRQPQCRNQGYILDGYPKTVQQARWLFEQDMPGEPPAEGEEEEPALEEGRKPMDDSLFPEYLVHLKASDTFLTERLLKVSDQHPHNTPAEFQNRLEQYKANNPPRYPSSPPPPSIPAPVPTPLSHRDRVEPTKDASKGLIAFLEASLTATDRALFYRQVSLHVM